ncbi:MAG: hypothetical protein RMJ18_02620 [Candidatus Aenigmarchaeota archaeon]|nr:hypothetical protein [Candidatus Aenigmarchaeota archaeon]MCX8191014.1 hypothetical protein [Candidatus Aenigmarchaeota archaeon]MDW8160285.1 hypothetical protein [Candidatus Aenigmarchaeota archaeon]
MAEKTTQPTIPIEIVSELNRRVRFLETRIENILSKISIVEIELEKIKEDQKVYNNFQSNNYKDVLSKLESLGKKITTLEASLESYVKKTDLEKIKTVVEIFNPLKSSFITREELELELDKIRKEFKNQK